MNTTYTMKNAAMSLATAREVLSTPAAGWSQSQVARAKAVAGVWQKRRAAQAKKAKQ